MRFELSLALKYLLPRAKQLSVSIISLISILVVALVVWLVVVFLSVTQGIEKKWLDELIALNAPLRMTPTEEYYKSYYYNIDQHASASNYATKSLGEKLLLETSGDPYDPNFDAELPANLAAPDTHPDGSYKDIAKEGWDAIHSIKGYSDLRGKEFEVTFGNLQIETVREKEEETVKSLISQLSYISSFDTQNHRLKKLILPPTKDDAKEMALYSEGEIQFPKKNNLGEAILVSKNFQNNGVVIGDTGVLSYYAGGSANANKEQRLPIYVAGFYDPGLMPVGNKVVFASPELLSILRGQLSFADSMLGNGFNIWYKHLSDTDSLKRDLQAELKKRGIDQYFTVESYADYELTKPVLDQLKSDKTLFTLIALIILIVACSNIISMLILLVNDKKKEIGILQSMGVTRQRVAIVFGLCGFLTGLIGSLAGIAFAVLTLHNINYLVNFLSFLQGREAFQAVFYGEGGLPSEVSPEVLLFVFIATVVISLLAGLVPAIKAAKIKPAVILRSE
jgi:lipoprotein-releasing system permease protein